MMMMVIWESPATSATRMGFEKIQLRPAPGMPEPMPERPQWKTADGSWPAMIC